MVRKIQNLSVMKSHKMIENGKIKKKIFFCRKMVKKKDLKHNEEMVKNVKNFHRGIKW